MIFEELDPFVTAIDVAQAILGAALLLCLVRVLRGPSVPDRVVALDVAMTVVVGIIGLETIVSNQHIFLRIAVLVTMLSFIGTVSFANYIAKGGRH